MELIELSPFIKPVAKIFRKNSFLLDEGGTNIPFLIHLSPSKIANQVYDVIWERTFIFPNGEKQFNSTMRFDLSSKTVTDFLGTPAIVKAPLQFDITKEGNLHMRSLPEQSLQLLNNSLRIPSLFSAKAYVEESFDELRQMHSIHLLTYSDSLGFLMKYVGYFTIEQNKKEQK